jgi:hypothetical protein
VINSTLLSCAQALFPSTPKLVYFLFPFLFCMHSAFSFSLLLASAAFEHIGFRQAHTFSILLGAHITVGIRSSDRAGWNGMEWNGMDALLAGVV